MKNLKTKRLFGFPLDGAGLTMWLKHDEDILLISESSLNILKLTNKLTYHIAYWVTDSPDVFSLAQRLTHLDQLRYLYRAGFTYREIAGVLDIPRNTVATQLRRYFPDRVKRTKTYMALQNKRNIRLARKSGKIKPCYHRLATLNTKS